MRTYTIHPLHVGTITRKSSNMEFQADPEIVREFPILCFYVTDGARHILVDTGGVVPGAPQHRPYTRTAEQMPDIQLKAFGVAPEQIDTVILTHLHWDHASNNALFPQAAFYVQKDELAYAANPPESQRFGYYPDLIFPTKYHELNGDAQICEGIRVALTPGHTDGHQSVIVDTENGRCAITGDLVNTYACWDAEPKKTGGYYTDLQIYQDSMYRLASMADYIVPSHDPLVLRWAFEKNGKKQTGL